MGVPCVDVSRCDARLNVLRGVERSFHDFQDDLLVGFRHWHWSAVHLDDFLDIVLAVLRHDKVNPFVASRAIVQCQGIISVSGSDLSKPPLHHDRTIEYSDRVCSHHACGELVACRQDEVTTAEKHFVDFSIIYSVDVLLSCSSCN